MKLVKYTNTLGHHISEMANEHGEIASFCVWLIQRETWFS